MAREGLRIPLRTALHKAAAARERTVQKQLLVQTNGGMSAVESLLDFQPANLYMIVFEESTGAAHSQPETRTPESNSGEETIRHLESELGAAQEHAQAAFEELETSKEEL
ncbi:MAG: hypothetical protein ACRD4G_12925, partial [Bryobacteraceae bacterium]